MAACDLCGENFRNNSTLKYHTQVWYCEACDSTFQCESDFIDHAPRLNHWLVKNLEPNFTAKIPLEAFEKSTIKANDDEHDDDKAPADSGMQVRMSPDQPSKIKEIKKGGVSDEQLKKEGPSRRMEKFEPNHGSKSSTRDPLPTVSADPGMQIRMTPDQPSQIKEIKKGGVSDEQLKKEGPSRRMEKFEPNHDSKSSTRDPLPTANQGAESSIKVKMSSDQPSRTKEIGKGFVNNEQSEREGPSRRMEKFEPNHDSKIRDPPPTVNQNPESNMQSKSEQSSGPNEEEIICIEQYTGLPELTDSEDEEESEGETDSENEKNHDGVLATLAKLENELDSIENSRNYSDGFFNNQIKGFDTKNRVKAEKKEIEVKTQEEPKEAVFKGKNSGACGCSNCNFTTTYLQSLKNHTNSIHEGPKDMEEEEEDSKNNPSLLKVSSDLQKVIDFRQEARFATIEQCGL